VKSIQILVNVVAKLNDELLSVSIGVPRRNDWNLYPLCNFVHNKDKNKFIRLEIIYENENLDLSDHLPKNEEGCSKYLINVDDTKTIQNILYALIEKYILWQYDAEYINELDSNWKESYNDEIQNIEDSLFYNEVKLINKINKEYSWKSFQNQKLLCTFTN